jgi:homocysteine S-methyltransferase
MRQTQIPTGSPIEPFVQGQGMMILDGGLATELEARGHDLNDDLWSAKLLLDAPEAVRQVHLDYLAAGADCIATITYQATVPGFRKHGLSENAAVDLMRYAVQLAVEARDEFWRDPVNRKGRLRPLVAASIGPYGAFLSDGSEYTGEYDIDEDALYRFHRSRWHVLADGPADLLACETIPSGSEARVLLRLLGESPGRWAWLSFSCRDEARLGDGSPLAEVARECDAEQGVMAVGVNCVPPAAVGRMIDEVRKGTAKPVIVYPNSGERYSAAAKAWRDAPPEVDWGDISADWAARGVAGIGGCCRVGPETISGIRQRVVG